MKSKEVIANLKEYARILNELNEAGVVRTYNSPVGDYAEWLVAEKLKLTLESNSAKGHDALDEKSGIRYQVKSRWIHKGTKNKALNVIRNYDENQFDYLIIVLFKDDFSVEKVYKVPHDVIGKHFTYNKHQNGYVVRVTKKLENDPEVTDITELFA